MSACRIPETFTQWNPMTDAFNARKDKMGSGALGEEVALAKRRDGIVIFVGGINPLCSKMAISNLFSKAGVVTKCDFAKRKNDSNLRVAFVGYRTQVEAEKAIEDFNGFEFAGATLRVSVALSDEEKKKRREEQGQYQMTKYEPTFEETKFSNVLKSHPQKDPYSALNLNIVHEPPDPTKGNIWGPEDDFTDEECEEPSKYNSTTKPNGIVGNVEAESNSFHSYYSSGPLEVGSVTDVYVVIDLYRTPVHFPCHTTHPREISIHQRYCDRPCDPSRTYEVGDLVAALYLGEYYRAAITSCVDEENFAVMFIDYGNEDCVTMTDLRPLDDCDLRKPSYLIYVSIEGTDESMCEEYHIKFSKMLSSEKILKLSGLITSYDDNKNLYTLRMGNLSYRKDVPTPSVERSSSIASPIKEVQGACGGDDTISNDTDKGANVTSPKVETETSKSILSLNDVAPNINLKVSSKWLELITLHFESLENFTLISDVNLRNLSDMSSSFEDQYRRKSGNFDSRHLTLGMVVVAFSDQYRAHFRSCITCIHPALRKVDVLFIDMGDTELLPYRNLYPVPERFCTKPQLSISCCLEGASTSDRKEAITEQLLDVFESKLPQMRRVQTLIKSKNESDDPTSPLRAVVELRISNENGTFSHISLSPTKTENPTPHVQKESKPNNEIRKKKEHTEDACYHPYLVERVKKLEDAYMESNRRIAQLQGCVQFIIQKWNLY